MMNELARGNINKITSRLANWVGLLTENCFKKDFQQNLT